MEREGKGERGQRRNIRHAKHAVILTMKRLCHETQGGVNVLIDGQAQTQHAVSSSEGGRRTASGKRQRVNRELPKTFLLWINCASWVHNSPDARGTEGEAKDCTRQVTPEA